MSRPQNAVVFDFEIFVLMTMKLRLSLTSDPIKKLRLQNKLAEYGLTAQHGELVHQRVAAALVDEDSFFVNLKTLLGADRGAEEVSFTSVLWPEFDFRATVNTDGQLKSARYFHTRKSAIRPQFKSPRDVPTWSMDLEEFAEHFGPLNLALSHPIFYKVLPAYEEHQFDWTDERGREIGYGAGFCWGLFNHAAENWD